VSSDCQSDNLWDHKSREKVEIFKRNSLRDGGFHKNETVYLLKETERVGSFYKNKTWYLISW